jgi:hypothetical protein
MGSLKFRVLLDSDKNEEVFRDIQINENDNFESLYHAILRSFGFEGNQMASFYISNDEWDKGHEIALTDMRYSDEEEMSIMKETTLNDHMEKIDQKIILVHDFMRMWIFLIELIDRRKEDVEAPQTILSIGMAPPEDSKMMQEDMDFGDDDFDDEQDDIFGDDDFEDGYDEEDYADYDRY